MSNTWRKHRTDQMGLLWWGLLGLGLGLVILSTMLWDQHGQSADTKAHQVAQGMQRLQPMLKKLKEGTLPPQALLGQTDATPLAPLMLALSDAQRQRQQVLTTYQTQIDAIALGDWLTPANLAQAQGRTLVRLRLTQLESALDELVQRDAAVHTQLDEATTAWLKQASPWANEAARSQMLSASGKAAQAMAAFFKIERDIVSSVNALLRHLDALGTQITLENGVQQELVFTHEADLIRYRSSLQQLAELGHREQELLLVAQGSSEQHARQVGELLLTALAPDH